MSASEWKVRPLAQDHVTVFQSPDPASIYCYSPGITVLPTGRLVATCDLGGKGVVDLPGPKAKRGADFGSQNQCKVFLSDDHGESWRHVADLPMLHARPFMAGGKLYILGHSGDLAISVSDNDGETWAETLLLSRNEHWHQAPCNVHYANGKVYLVMERRVREGDWCCRLAPVLMAAKEDSDLMKRESWTFASELCFEDAVKPPYGIGVPFYTHESEKEQKPGQGCYMNSMGWLETNVVQFVDPDNYLYDPNGKTFHLWIRAHTGRTNIACIAKVIEHEDGRLQTMLEKAPSGEDMVYVACPGGQMKFHILYDEVTKLYWLLNSQATDSTRRPDTYSEDRSGLPDNERHRLQLHFSKNCFDWRFAGLVAVGESEKASRHYASMAFDGDDLAILSRSGTQEAKSAHDGNMITFHKINNFRDLVY